MTSLTARYVHATTRSLPEARRADIRRELVDAAATWMLATM